MNKLTCALEALLFSAGAPLALGDIAGALGLSDKEASDLVHNLMNTYDSEKRGFKIIRLEDSFQMCSREDYHEYIRRVRENARKQALSNAALETLSIIAYNQPVTRSRIDFIRDVDCTGSIATLVQRGLIEEAGRMDTPGKPILYKTTDEFLRCFGLSSLSELPEVEELSQIK